MLETAQIRKIVRIDPDKCDGCGLCVPSCAEGAIRIVDGKARLAADNLCDGLGNCLGTCPRGAITIEERPAEEFSEQAVEAHKQKTAPKPPLPCGCPGTLARLLKARGPAQACAQPGSDRAEAVSAAGGRPSRLGNFPVQLALVPPSGPTWQGADVLLAADCVAFALPDFYDRLLIGRTLAVACPKLDDVGPYVEKLANIFANNDIRSLTVARMEVPCCGGLVRAAQAALERCGRDIPLRVVTVHLDGTTEETDGRQAPAERTIHRDTTERNGR